MPIRDGNVARSQRGPRRVISEAVAERIESKILDGTFRPGQRLPAEREIAAELKVNRSSVREALKRLQQLGLVEIQRGSGIRVRSPEQAGLDLVARMIGRGGPESRTLVRDLLELKEVLLTGFVQLGLERATEAELRELEGSIARAADPKAPRGELERALQETQDRVALMTHNRVVLLLWNTLRRIAEREPGVNAAAAPPAVVPALRRFGLAAVARDADSARRALRELLRAIDNGVLAALESAKLPLGP